MNPVGGLCHPKLAGVIRHPGRNIARVFPYQPQIAGVDVETVGIEELWVALVHADEKIFFDILPLINDADPDIFKRGQVLEIRAVTIDAVSPIVLIAVFVHQVDEALVVGPEIISDIPLGRLGDPGGRLFADLLYENIEPVFPGHQEGEILAVGRNLEGGFFRIPEKISHGD
jgi:hypothetical protein